MNHVTSNPLSKEDLKKGSLIETSKVLEPLNRESTGKF